MEFVSSLKGGDGLRVEETLGNGYVRLRVSEAERRQAKHDIRCVEDAVIELLRNSRDAGARHIFVATAREGNLRTIVVIDDGSGIPPEMHKRVFDARVTSKLDSVHMDRWGVHGRGMALFSIFQNAEEARVVASDVGIGTSLCVTFDVSKITERADQSTWPTVSTSSKEHDVRGPRNIARACVEFALEAKEQCNVYFGSPSEMVATMRKRMRAKVNALHAHALGERDAVPLAERPSLADDAKELRSIAAELGIDMSERTAHRIVRNQIQALQNVRTRVLGTPVAPVVTQEYSDKRVLSLSKEDKSAFERQLMDAFKELSERYYITLDAAPRIRSGKGFVQVTFEYSDDL